MKKSILLACAIVIGWTGAFAQQEVEAPRFNGTTIRIFMARLAAMAEKVAVEQKVPADSLSPVVGLALRIDKEGNMTDWQFLDNTREGRDRADFAPATDATRRVMEEAYARLDGTWSPATQDGVPRSYTARMTIRIPVEKIERQQNPDPLLFMGEDPTKAFFDWVYVRVRYDTRFAKVGGLVRVQFYIEPDGKITIGKVLESPDEKLTKEVLRVIRNSKGKWTPRKVRGVPQRTSYEFRCNFIPEGH